jgi:ABC-type glutathione transport system ATPase component
MMPPCTISARRRAMVSHGWRCLDDAPRRAMAYRASVSLALRARTLWKSYAAGVEGCSVRAWVLRGANLHFERGECVAILGARGAGSTTLLHCLAGLRRPDAGSIETGLEPMLVGAEHFHQVPLQADRLLLIDDDLRLRHAAPRPRFVREPHLAAPTSIIATHELARVRDVADRVLLLHHGRLVPLDRQKGTRRVAEHVARSK